MAKPWEMEWQGGSEKPAVKSNRPWDMDWKKEEAPESHPVKGVLEGAASFVSSIPGAIATSIAEPIGRILDKPEIGKVAAKAGEAITYEPKTEEGKKVRSVIQWPFEKLSEGIQFLGGIVGKQKQSLVPHELPPEMHEELLRRAEETGSGMTELSVNLALMGAPLKISRGAKGELIPPTPKEAAKVSGAFDNLVKQDVGKAVEIVEKVEDKELQKNLNARIKELTLSDKDLAKRFNDIKQAGPGGMVVTDTGLQDIMAQAKAGEREVPREPPQPVTQTSEQRTALQKLLPEKEPVSWVQAMRAFQKSPVTRTAEDQLLLKQWKEQTGDITLEERARNPESSGIEVGEASMAEFEEAQKASDQTHAMIQKGTVELNGSGESSASMEAINRMAEEKVRDRGRYVLDAGTGQVRPLIGPEAVDMRAQSRQVIVQKNIGDKTWTVLDHDQKLTPQQVESAVARLGKEDPVVYMNMGVPVTKSMLINAFNSVHDLAKKSETYRTLEGEIATSVDQLIRSVAPEALGPEAKKAAAVVAKNVAEQMQSDSANFHQSKNRRTFWNHREGEVDSFVEGFERGKRFEDETLNKAAEAYRSWNERIAAQDQALNLKYEPRENYLYHTFKDSEGVTRFFESKYGGKWNDPKFIKERGFNLYKEAKDAGFEPKFTNPEDIMLARQHASDVAQMRIQTLREMEKYGLARKVSENAEERIPGDIQWRSPNGEQYWVHEDAAQILHNAFNTRSLWNMQGIGGSAFRATMWAKNVIVPIKLALSLFHPLHVQTIDNATGMVRASKELLSGTMDPGTWIKEMGKSALYKGIISGPKEGSRLLNVWKGKIAEGDLTPADRQSLTYMVEGGFIPEMAAQYKIGAIEKLKDAIQRRSATALFHLPFAAIDAIQKPMFEKWIPALKAASYLQDVKTALKTNPELMDKPLERQEAFRKLAKSVENRYGEMAYNTLFWNRWVKDLGVASTLSLGWNLGFLREYGGGAMDMGKAVLGDGTIANKASKGQLDRPLFLLYYTTQALAYGGLLTWGLTGTTPKDWMDFVFPRTGDKNRDGTDARVNTMFYPREFASIYKHMEHEGVGSGLGKLVLNKASPVLGLAHDWASNVDYFGKEISDPDAPAYKRLQQKLAHTFSELEPIAMQSVNRGQAEPTGKSRSLAFAGFSPAPSYVTETASQALIKTLYQRYHKSTTPYSRAEYSDDARTLRSAFLKDDQEAIDNTLNSMQEKYDLTPKQIRNLQKNIHVSPTVKMFKGLNADQQKQVLNSMEADEREEFLAHAHKNLRRNYEAPEK